MSVHVTARTLKSPQNNSVSTVSLTSVYMLTIYVGHTVLGIVSNVKFGHFSLVLGVLRPGEQAFPEGAVEHLDEAVCVGVIVDAASVTLSPTQRHQVKLPIAAVHQISCVPVQGTCRIFMSQQLEFRSSFTHAWVS